MSLTFLPGMNDGTSVWKGSKTTPAVSTAPSRLNHPDLHVTSDKDDQEGESYNAIALDIIQTLKCHKLLNQTKQDNRANRDRDGYHKDDDDRYNSGDGNSGSGSGEGDDDDDDTKDRRQRRRLDEEERPENSGSEDVRDDDDANHANDRPEQAQADGFIRDSKNHYTPITGQHLFCLAAFSASDKEIDDIKDKVHCDATHTRQQTLLDLWSAARSEMPEEILLQTLEVAVEEERELVGHQVYLWAPTNDDGLEWQPNSTNKDVGRITTGE
jgi:hypothetical protein